MYGLRSGIITSESADPSVVEGDHGISNCIAVPDADSPTDSTTNPTTLQRKSRHRSAPLVPMQTIPEDNQTNDANSNVTYNKDATGTTGAQLDNATNAVTHSQCPTGGTATLQHAALRRPVHMTSRERRGTSQISMYTAVAVAALVRSTFPIRGVSGLADTHRLQPLLYKL